MVHRFLPALALGFLLAGCLSSGPIGPIGGASKFDVSATQVTMYAQSGQRVAVTVIDERPYVVSGKESDQFLGTEQGNWAQTQSIKTASGRSFADEMADVIVRGLANSGIAALPMPQKRATSQAESVAAFQAQGADRLLEVRIADYRMDSYTRVHLQWRLDVAVYDRSGAMLGRSSTSGKAPIGGTGTLLGDDAQKLFLEQLSRRLTNILNEPRITDALA